MNYIENIYICIAAPIIVAVLSLKNGRRRMMIFLLAGMTACILSSYISTFFVIVYNADRFEATWEITPLIEEIVKFLPILFYMLVFEPDNKEEIAGSVMLVAVGFATFENICYLSANDASQMLLLLIRGFGTGAMHVVCGVLVAIGTVYLWDEFWLRFAGTAGLITFSITFHAIYNILVSQEGFVSYIGYLIPMLTATLIFLLRRTVTKNTVLQSRRHMDHVEED